MAWVDNLRTLIIILVVNMHACVTYSHVGDWYIMEAPEPTLAGKLPFILWQGHLQSFFMGLLFLLSGAFAHASLQRRGPASFVKERAFRLCLPALFYMLIIHPFMVFVLLRRPGAASIMQRYVGYLASGHFLSGSGPLWFALALFGFSLGLVTWRRGAILPPSPERPPPGAVNLLGFAAILTLATFLIRLVQPIGTNFLNFQFCFFPQYIAAFGVGVAAARFGWLEPLAASRRGRIAGWLGLALGPLALLSVIYLGGPPPEQGRSFYAGGWHLQAFGLAAWEQFTGLALGLGLMACCFRRLNFSRPATRWLGDRSFAVYVLHPPVLVGLTLLLRPLVAAPASKTVLLTVLGVVASYLVAALARRIPGLRAIL